MPRKGKAKGGKENLSTFFRVGGLERENRRLTDQGEENRLKSPSETFLDEETTKKGVDFSGQKAKKRAVKENRVKPL